MVSSIPIMYLVIDKIARCSRCFLPFHKSRCCLAFAHMPDMPIEFSESPKTLPTDRRTGNCSTGIPSHEWLEAVEATASAEDHGFFPRFLLGSKSSKMEFSTRPISRFVLFRLENNPEFLPRAE